MTGERDEALGEMLRALDVPDHAPEFFEQLLATIAVGPAPARARSERRRRVMAVALAAVAVVVVAMILPGLGTRSQNGSGGGPFGPEPAAAAEVIQKAVDAVGQARTVSGQAHLLDVGADGTTTRQDVSFVLTAGGDYRVDDAASGVDESYQAATGTMTTVRHDAGGGASAVIETGVAPGPPDGGAVPFGGVDLGGSVEALVVAGDPAVTDTLFGGRPAWRIDANLTPNLIGPSADQIHAVIDKATALPVQVDWSRAGVVQRQLVVTAVVDQPALPAVAVMVPPGAPVTKVDGGFHVVHGDQAAGSVGYRPPVPAFVPAGFHLAETAVAVFRQPTGREGSNPPSRQVLARSYRRGLQQFVLTTRLTGPDRFAWSDPFASEGQVLRAQPVDLHFGALAGAMGQVVVDPLVVPHLWVVGSDLVATVAGDLSAADMDHIAESLQQ